MVKTCKNPTCGKEFEGRADSEGCSASCKNRIKHLKKTNRLTPTRVSRVGETEEVGQSRVEVEQSRVSNEQSRVGETESRVSNEESRVEEFQAYAHKEIHAINKNCQILMQLLAGGKKEITLPELSKLGYNTYYSSRQSNEGEIFCFTHGLKASRVEGEKTVYEIITVTA